LKIGASDFRKLISGLGSDDFGDEGIDPATFMSNCCAANVSFGWLLQVSSVVGSSTARMCVLAPLHVQVLLFQSIFADNSAVVSNLDKRAEKKMSDFN
jgi:hypothetical protein